MYSLNISPQARDDLVEIKNYISCELKNQPAAAKIISQIIEKIETLTEFPKLGKTLSGVVNVPTDYRFVVSGNYLVFYRVEKNEVFVSRVLYAKRDYVRALFAE